MSFGRIFPLGRENKRTLQIRAEFQNIFNRLFYASPAANGFGAYGLNPVAVIQNNNSFSNGQLGALSSGYGFVNSVNGGPVTGPETPRSGQIVARFQF